MYTIAFYCVCELKMTTIKIFIRMAVIIFSGALKYLQSNRY